MEKIEEIRKKYKNLAPPTGDNWIPFVDWYSDIQILLTCIKELEEENHTILQKTLEKINERDMHLLNIARTRISELEERLTIKILENAKGAQVLAELEGKVKELEYRGEEDRESSRYFQRKLEQAESRLNQVIQAVEKHIFPLLQTIQQSHKGSIGAINNVYLPQLDKQNIDNIVNELYETVERIRKD